MFGVTIATASLMWGFQVLKVVDLNLVDTHKKSNGVKSGDLGGQVISPPLLIHLTIQVIPKTVAET
jgi:hypothetical protein